MDSIKILIIEKDGREEIREYTSPYEFQKACKALDQLEALDLIEGTELIYH